MLTSVLLFVVNIFLAIFEDSSFENKYSNEEHKSFLEIVARKICDNNETSEMKSKR